MSFMFDSEEQAKNCIQVVSNLYKRLKSNSKKQPKVNQEAQSDLVVKTPAAPKNK